MPTNDQGGADAATKILLLLFFPRYTHHQPDIAPTCEIRLPCSTDDDLLYLGVPGEGIDSDTRQYHHAITLHSPYSVGQASEESER